MRCKPDEHVDSTLNEFCIGVLADSNRFGSSVAAMKSINNDMISDLAVGVPENNDGGYARGATYVLFIATTGAVSSFQKVSDTTGSFTGIYFKIFFGSVDLNSAKLAAIFMS